MKKSTIEFVFCVQWTNCQNDYSSFFFQTKIRLEYNIGWLYLFNGCFFFLFYHQIKSKRNPREQRDKRKIASSVPIGWTQFTFSSQNVCWNGLPLLTQHSLLFLISIFSLDDKANFYLSNLRINVRSAFPALNWTCESYHPCG